MSEQRTDEWFADRCGKFTGSRFVDVLARSKKDGKPLKAFYDVIEQVVVERLYGKPVEGAVGAALRWGSDVEPSARAAYELETGYAVSEEGFIQHAQFEFAGCSPDGIIGTDGGIEMKCPNNPAIHIKRFTEGMEDEHMPQVQGCMWVTGRKWWDFVSYDPRAPERFQIYIQRVERDEAYIANLQASVIEADALANKLIGDLESKLNQLKEAA